MDTNLVFFIGVAFFVNHELDAIHQHEWRFFFTRTTLSDETAYRLFTALHAPLFVLIMWFAREGWFQVGFDMFLIIHLGLHVALRHHPLVTFTRPFSWLWIVGGALMGLVHLVVH